MKFVTFFVVLWLLPTVFALPIQAQATEIAGEVVMVRGTISANIDGNHRVLAVGDAVHRGEVIRTGRATRVRLRLGDGSEITLGDGSDLIIDDYVYAPEQDQGNIALSLTRGVFLAVSGGISTIKDAPLTVTTPIATIGIRGTTFWGAHSATGSEVAMLDGKGIFITNQFGRVDIDQAGDGTDVAFGEAPVTPFVWSSERLAASLAQIQ